MKPVLVACIMLSFCCHKKSMPSGDPLPFEAVPALSPILPGAIDEASGIADSKINPGFLWVEQDSGNPPEICLLRHDGTIKKKIYLKGIQNRDWEDLALGDAPNGPGQSIYLADIGDNDAVHSSYTIYRFDEPLASADTVSFIDKINFRYPDGAHDAEAILVEKQSKHIFIITKRDTRSMVYKLSYPQSTSQLNLAELVGELPFNGVVSAAISPGGDEVLVKTYTGINYWKGLAGKPLEQLLKTAPVALPYELEAQGEALCFKQDNGGFFSISEKPMFAAAVSLRLYKRK